MKEFPVFVPFGAEHLAAVLTLPDGEPRGLAVLLTGTGATRSHRFSLWTRAARELANRGLASVRMDYIGVGDSSGMIYEHPLVEIPTDQAGAVTQFAIQATGIDRFAVVGNCLGSSVALTMAAEVPGCVGAVAILAYAREPSGRRKLTYRIRRSSLGKAIRRNRVLRELVRRFKGKGKAVPGIRERVEAILARGHLAFLYSERDDTYTPAVKTLLDGIVAELPAEQRARYELRVVSGGPLHRFESAEIQDLVLDSTVNWLDRFFEPAPSVRQAEGAETLSASTA